MLCLILLPCMSFTGWKSSQREQGVRWESGIGLGMGAYLIFHAPGNKRRCIRSLPSAHLWSFSWVCFWVNYYWHRHSWKRLSKNLWSLDEVWVITLSLTSCRRAENELLWCSQFPTDISIILYPTRLRAHHGADGRKIVSVRDEGDPVWIWLGRSIICMNSRSCGYIHVLPTIKSVSILPWMREGTHSIASPLGTSSSRWLVVEGEPFSFRGKDMFLWKVPHSCAHRQR